MANTLTAYRFWTDAGDENDILASSLQEAADIASHKIPVPQWADGAWGWVQGPDGCQMPVPARTKGE